MAAAPGRWGLQVLRAGALRSRGRLVCCEVRAAQLSRRAPPTLALPPGHQPDSTPGAAPPRSRL